MNPSIEHLLHQSRFQAAIEGRTCELDYQVRDGVMTITHTGVPAPLGGRGIAAALTAAALTYAREHGLKVQPVCSYARAYMQRHPDTLALLAR